MAGRNSSPTPIALSASPDALGQATRAETAMPLSSQAALVGDELNRARRLGYTATFAFVLVFGVWSAMGKIGGAVIAPAQVVIDTNVKRVQHSTGGIVAELFVREGDHVEEGGLLARLDATAAAANLQILQGQIEESLVRKARLESENQRLATIVLPEELHAVADKPEIIAVLASEERLFRARHTSRETQRAVLNERIAQSRSESEGLRRSLEARRREAAIVERELVGVRQLFSQKLIQLPRLLQLEREASTIEGALGQIEAQLEQNARRIGEIQMTLRQIDETLEAENFAEIRSLESKLMELREKRTAAEDQLRRIDIRAPVAGQIHQLAVHTRGGVVAPGETMMLIVPRNEDLQLEARVLPSDYDQVSQGQKARIRLHAFNQRTTPELSGEVRRVAADIVRDPQTGVSYFPVRVTIPREEQERIAPSRINVGMQADVFFRTTERSPVDFLLRPLTDQLARSMRER